MKKAVLTVLAVIALIALFFVLFYSSPVVLLSGKKPVQAPATDLNFAEFDSNTAAPELPEGLGFAELSNGKISLYSRDGEVLISFHELNPFTEAPVLDDLSKMPAGSELTVDYTELGASGFKWGYHFKLPSLNFRAGLLVEAQNKISIPDPARASLVVNRTNLDFEDFAQSGFGLVLSQIDSNTVLISVSRDYKEADINVGNWVYLDPYAFLN